jgi:hypothetical protein
MKLIAVRTHRSAYPDPITFRRGETLSVGRRDEEFPGWIWVTLENGNQGWAPEQYLDLHGSGTVATATEHYCARELDTIVGEILTLHLELKQWLLVENSSGEIGWVPKATTATA